MEPEEIPDPHELWWSTAVLAALHRAAGRPGCTLDAARLVLALDPPDGSWLRLQRCRGGRHVLWGGSRKARPAPRDARREAPDWALTEATDGRHPTFVAWFAHDEWDCSTPQDDGIPALLHPALSVDPRLTAAAALERLDEDDLAAHLARDRAEPTPAGGDLRAAVSLLRAAAAPPSRARVRARLRDQVHGQMREAREADRMLLQQPPAVVRWGQVHGHTHALEYAVILRQGEMVPAPTNTALPRTARHALEAVLRGLHVQEADDDHGAWLFARVASDGVVTTFDRAFDHWPTWWRVAHPAQGPSLDDLAWEMAQRAPRWRPPWASLLPQPTR